MSHNLESRPYTTWQLIKAYWQSEYKLSAYVFIATVLLMSMFIVGLDVILTDWYNYFYDALQDYDRVGALDLLGIFLFIAGVYIVVAVYRYYLQQILALRWRNWLTKQFLDRWLAKRSYYYLEDFDEQTDNPDQRIQEDINSLVNASLSLAIGLVSSIVTFFAFIYVLWTLSGTINLPLGHFGTLHIRGYLVWVAVIYALVGTYCTFKIGRPLVPLNFEQQRREANFRFSAIDVRSHAENIALYRGEGHQKNLLRSIFSSVLNNWYAIILRQKLLLWFTAGYNQISVILPLIVALPNYFNKVFKLGGLMQTLSAFRQIQDALSFIVNSYTSIAEWQAVNRRLLSFLNHIQEVEHNAEEKNQFSYVTHDSADIVVKQLTVCNPHGDRLLADINEEFKHGHHYWVKGPSGIGKSTFVRVLAGIWPYGKGEIDLPKDKNILYLPQRSYMPLGTLRDALLFPHRIQPVNDNVLIELLHACDLHELTQKLNYVTAWSEHLSPGELQRIAFVRVLIHRPDWLFLDESTSALDIEHEISLYKLLKTRLPHCSIVSIGHRPSLKDYHDQEIDLEKYKVLREEYSAE